MPSIIQQQAHGLNAFIDKGCGMQLAMSGGAPYVEWGFRIEQLQQWLTTMEETIAKEANFHNRSDLEGIFFSLKAAYARHLEQHKEIVTDAPSADDLQAYLSAYAAAVGGKG